MSDIPDGTTSYIQDGMPDVHSNSYLLHPYEGESINEASSYVDITVFYIINTQ